MTFYKWFEGLTVEAIEKKSGKTKVFESESLERLVDMLRAHPRSPYISDLTVKNLVYLVKEKEKWAKVVRQATLEKSREVLVFDESIGDEDNMPLEFLDMIRKDGTIDLQAWGRTVKLHTWIRTQFR
jgi:hypothetical protein